LHNCLNTLVESAFYRCRIAGMKPIEIAIEAAGNAHRLAKGIKVPPQSVIFWRDGDREIPAEYCPRIEALTGVRCEDLRPDVQWSVLRQPAEKAAA